MVLNNSKITALTLDADAKSNQPSPFKSAATTVRAPIALSSTTSLTSQNIPRSIFLNTSIVLSPDDALTMSGSPSSVKEKDCEHKGLS